MKQTAFITGATSGIGKATAEIFAKKQHSFNSLWKKSRKINGPSRRIE